MSPPFQVKTFSVINFDASPFLVILVEYKKKARYARYFLSSLRSLVSKLARLARFTDPSSCMHNTSYKISCGLSVYHLNPNMFELSYRRCTPERFDYKAFVPQYMHSIYVNVARDEIYDGAHCKLWCLCRFYHGRCL